MFLEISTYRLVVYFSYAVFLLTIWLSVAIHRKKTHREIQSIIDTNSPFNALRQLTYSAGEAVIRMIIFSILGMTITIILFDLVPIKVQNNSLYEFGMLIPIITLFIMVSQTIKAARYLKGAKNIKEDQTMK